MFVSELIVEAQQPLCGPTEIYLNQFDKNTYLKYLQ